MCRIGPTPPKLQGSGELALPVTYGNTLERSPYPSPRQQSRAGLSGGDVYVLGKAAPATHLPLGGLGMW